MADIITDTLDNSIRDNENFKFVQYSKPDDDINSKTSEQKKSWERNRKGNALNSALQAASLGLGAASLATIPFPWVSYGLGALSSVASGIDTGILFSNGELSKAQALGRLGVDVLGLVPGGIWANRFWTGRKGAQTASNIMERTSAIEIQLGDARKAKELAEQALQRLPKDADKVLRKAKQNEFKNAAQKVEDLQKELKVAQNTKSTGSVGKAEYAKAEGLRLLGNTAINGGIQYGAPGLYNAYQQEDPGVLGYATQGFKDFGHDVYNAFGNGDAVAASNLWNLAASTLRTGAGSNYSRLPRKATAATTAAASTAGTTTAGTTGAATTGTTAGTAATGTGAGTTAGLATGIAIASSSPQTARSSTQKSLVMPNVIYINPQLGNKGPAIRRGKNTSDEQWYKMVRAGRPKSGNGILVYDKNNNQLVLSAKDQNTYTLHRITSNGDVGDFIREIPVGDKLANYLFASKSGYDANTTRAQFEAMPYFRSNGQFYRKGGKLNTLKNLRYENNT